MKYFFILGALFSTLIFADKTVVKTVTINQIYYPDKSFFQVKEIALQEAKDAAAKEIYGEVLISETVMVNGKILDDVVREQSGGTVRIKGEPKFRNGENFGDIVVTIEAYATDEDLQKAALEKVKTEAKKEKDESTVNDADKKIEHARRGFYGIWSGFVIKNDGSSSDVVIEITDSGEATINYNFSNCGGDLIVQEKNPTIVRFQEKLTYGEEKCRDGLFVVLKKINSTQSLFMQFDTQEREVAKGTLYREE